MLAPEKSQDGVLGGCFFRGEVVSGESVMHLSELASKLQTPGNHSIAKGVDLLVSSSGTIKLKTEDGEKPFSPGIRPKVVAKAVNGYLKERLISR